MPSGTGGGRHSTCYSQSENYRQWKTEARPCVRILAAALSWGTWGTSYTLCLHVVSCGREMLIEHVRRGCSDNAVTSDTSTARYSPDHGIKQPLHGGQRHPL